MADNHDDKREIEFPGMVQEPAGQVSTTGETKPAAAPQRYRDG